MIRKLDQAGITWRIAAISPSLAAFGHRPIQHIHKAPRFMPYWNDPRSPDHHYKTKGWINAGLSQARSIVVKRYIRDYEVQNRYSPGRGAIVLEGTFYIHGGPAGETDIGFGSAGCIEIIGDYDLFKSHIAKAQVPDIKAQFTREL